MLPEFQTFPCTNCNEIINSSSTTCRFCQAPVDPVAAAFAAQNQAKVNRACSDASYLRTAATIMWIFLGLSFIPVLPLVGGGFTLTFIVVLVMLIVWQARFSGLVTQDPDYPKAKRSKNLSFLLWLLALPVAFIIKPIVQMLLVGP